MWASFNRLYMPPQVENLLLASSPQARRLSPFTNGSSRGGSDIAPETSSACEVGVSQQLPETLRLNLAYWRRDFRNIDDPNRLFSTTIIFPNSVAAAHAEGLDVRLDVPERHGWSGYLSYTKQPGHGNRAAQWRPVRRRAQGPDDLPKRCSRCQITPGS